MKDQTLPRSMKRSIALAAFGFIASLSLSTEASPVEPIHGGHYGFDVFSYQHSYNGHRSLTHRGHGYVRFDHGWYDVPRHRRFRFHGEHTEFRLRLYDGGHRRQNNHVRQSWHG